MVYRFHRWQFRVCDRLQSAGDQLHRIKWPAWSFRCDYRKNELGGAPRTAGTVLSGARLVLVDTSLVRSVWWPALAGVVRMRWISRPSRHAADWIASVFDGADSSLRDRQR